MAKLTTLFILLSLMQVSAKVYSQAGKLDLSIKKATILQVFDEIEDNSSYRFFYDNEHVDLTKEVSIESTNQEIAAVLQELFEGTDLTYQVNDQLILVQSKKAKLLASSQQQKSITGKITGQDGQPLPGVTVLLKGTTTGTITNVDGEYALTDVPVGSTLVFSFVGMRTQEILIENQTTVDITLIDEAIGLDDVIVIGYGTAKRKDFTGSVSSVSIENSAVAQIPNSNALEAIKGNVAGLNIGPSNSAGDQPSMQIRGQNSISGSNNPLIVLDGVIYLGSLSDINPNDIASVDVLKDAVSAAVYGSRSANGVIAINTKRGHSQKPVISLNVNTGIKTWQNRPEMMKGEQWIKVVNARNGYEEGSTSWMKTGELENLAAGEERVWLDEISQVGMVQDYQLSVSGAAKGLNYYLSTGYEDSKGVVIGDDFERISILGKINTNITSWLKLGVDASYARRDYSGFAAAVGSAQTMSPYGVMYRDDDGNLEKYPYTQSGVNPLWGVGDGTRENKDIRQHYRLNSYLVVDVPFIKGLSYRFNLLKNYNETNSGNFYYEDYYIAEGEGLERYSSDVVFGYLAKANGTLATAITKSYVVDNILTYKNQFGKHNVEGTLVATRDYTEYDKSTLTGSDFAANGNTSLGMSGLHFASTQKFDLDAYEHSNIGYLGRASYSYNDKYFVTGSYRRDGSSVFGNDNKWGNFAAFGLAWNITNEDFMSNVEYLDNLKIKLSWGQNGNQGIDPYTTLSQVKNGSSGKIWYEFADEQGYINYGLIQSSLGNQELGWEKTNAWNAGFESAWLNNRLTVDADFYYSQTTDQIFKRTIPVMTGFSSIYDSMGQVDNKGINLTVRSVNIRNSDLTWSTTFTLWKNWNKLVELYGEDNDGDGVEDDDISNSLFIGESIGSIYGYDQDGLVQEDDVEYTTLTGTTAGAPKYKDHDGVDGITSDDRIILGNSKANFYLNMSNTVSFKNFQLYTLINGTFGGNNYFVKSNTTAFLTSGTGTFNANMTYKPYWTSENPNNVYPRATFSGDGGRYKALQSRGFVRIQDITLSYTFNQPWVKEANISSLKVFFAAKNVACFTNWDGGDPETGATYLSSTMPVMSTYSLGATISF